MKLLAIFLFVNLAQATEPSEEQKKTLVYSVCLRRNTPLTLKHDETIEKLLDKAKEACKALKPNAEN